MHLVIIRQELAVLDTQTSKIINSVEAGRTTEGRTVLNLGFENVYAYTPILVGVVPAEPTILYHRAATYA